MIIVFSRLQPFFQHSLFFLYLLGGFRSLSPTFLLFLHLVGILPFVISNFSVFSSFGWNSSVRHLQLFCFFFIWLKFFRSSSPTFLLILHLGGFFDSSVVYYCPYRLTMPLLYPDTTISFSLICTVTVPVSAVAKTLLPTFFNRSNVS